MTRQQVSQMDKDHLELLRRNVKEFTRHLGERFDGQDVRVLDIAPQDHEGAKPHFHAATIDTLDIDPQSGATYIADLCVDNSGIIPASSYDVVVCTEVLEHTLNPFGAVAEMKRIVKSGGIVAVSTPFNLRIHGPLPDCWRFTEHGLRALFKEFEIVSLEALETEDRFLMPIHYTLVARRI